MRAVRIWAATGALAAAAGPVVGGLLVTASWRWVFLVNIPIGIAAFVGRCGCVPNPRHDPSAAVPDLLGALLLAIASERLSLGLVKAPDWGWTSRRCSAAWPAHLIGVGIFWRRSGSHLTGRRTGPAAGAGVLLVQRHRGGVHHRLRRGPAGKYPVDAGGLALLGTAYRTGHRTRADDGADVRRRRSARRPPGARRLDRRGRVRPVRRRNAADPVQRRRGRLVRDRRAARLVTHRRGCRPGAAHDLVPGDRRPAGRTGPQPAARSST